MPLLDDILTWSQKSLSDWQRDALRRLFLKDTLEPQDYDDLYAFLKSSQGITDSSSRQPIPLSKEYLPGLPTSSSPVILTAMRDLNHVNRIATGQQVVFSPAGMTIIYGGNGSGKSGYSRVLKRACRSRDLTETVLPNAFDTSTVPRVPEATFDLQIGGTNTTISWRHNQISPDELSTIAVFDGKCARAYLDSEQDVAFVPYGLDIVENLAQIVMKELSRRLDEEIASVDTDVSPFNDLAGDTVVGQLLSSLSARTDPKRVESLATLSSDEITRLSDLDKMLAEADPKAKAASLRLTAQRLQSLISRIDAALAIISDSVIERMKTLDSETEAAIRAESIAATQLQADEELLPGTGEQVWKLLFDAAKRFSQECAYVGKSFPNTADGAKCPLCQEVFPESAIGRMQRFAEYISQDIAKQAADKRTNRSTELNKLSAAALALNLDQALSTELSQFDPKIPELIAVFEKTLDNRKSWMIARFGDHAWDAPPSTDSDPRPKLKLIADDHTAKAAELDKVANADERKTLENERANLRARANLSVRAKALTALIQRMDTKAKLLNCKEGLKTTAISNKAKEFASQAVTATLKTALDKELAALGVGHIKTELKERVVQGKMKHKLVLVLPVTKKIDLHQILSEGEQRAIAIASFLAELQLSGHPGAIIFDDPVSSLDHHRRQAVATRLVTEAKNRQVVIFTHDTTFLGELSDRIEQENVSSLVYHLDWENDRPGVVMQGLPWGHKSCDERFDALEKLQRTLVKSWPTHPGEKDCAEIRHAYNFLRATIERVVQDVVFNGVVKRYRDWIRIDNLKGVAGLTDADCNEIARIHKACCNVVDAHDPASAKNAAVPTPQQLLNDISALKAVVDAIKTRRKASSSSAQKVTP